MVLLVLVRLCLLEHWRRVALVRDRRYVSKYSFDRQGEHETDELLRIQPSSCAKVPTC